MLIGNKLEVLSDIWHDERPLEKEGKSSRFQFCAFLSHKIYVTCLNLQPSVWKVCNGLEGSSACFRARLCFCILARPKLSFIVINKLWLFCKVIRVLSKLKLYFRSSVTPAVKPCKLNPQITPEHLVKLIQALSLSASPSATVHQ